MRISEKRYQAEQELEELKALMKKKNNYITELEIKAKEMRSENTLLKGHV